MRYRSALLMACAFGFQMGLADLGVAQDNPPSIVPRPAEVEMRTGEFRITESTEILVFGDDPAVKAIAANLTEELEKVTGWRLKTVTPSPDRKAERAIQLTTSGGNPQLGPEGYELTVAPDVVMLRAPTAAGLFYGVQTIRQLLSPGRASVQGARPGSATLPCLYINDKPRYRWRGMLLDCGRHFMTPDFVRRYIDLLAYHKMNVLHWHLTEDQGWRIEIKKYPRLTEVGAWHGEGEERYGGFYTQEDVKDIVAYARSRYITIVPEIEMPGHSLGALAAYPELSCTGGPFRVSTRWGVHSEVYCAGNDQTFEFLQNVLTEVVELFPSEFIHIGGDECPKARWEKCEKCQARIEAEGLKDEHELQSYFIRRMEKFLNSKNRHLIGWDEILEGGLAPNATVQSWRGMNGAVAAAIAGHDVISSPTSHCYLDYAQLRTTDEPTFMGFLPLERVYSFEPTPQQLTPDQARHILGAEGNMWTEHAPQERVDYQVFPRLCALAEVTWSPAGRRDWDNFCLRMGTHYQRLDDLGVAYFVAPPDCTSPDRVFSDSIEVAFENPFERGHIHYTVDGSTPTANSPRYTKPVHLQDTTVVKARTFLTADRSSSVAELRFENQEPLQPRRIVGATPGLTYEYYEGRWEQLPDFDELTPVATGVVDTFDLDLRQRDANFAVRFAGYVSVPMDGAYSFCLTSDDGSKLWVGSHVVVDNDGLHGAVEQRGQVILKAGLHPITVAFFQVGGPHSMNVNYAGPGIERQTIPDNCLFHVKHRDELPRQRAGLRKDLEMP